MKKFISTKAQVWGFDLFIAITIFLLGIIILYIYAINFLDNSQDNLNDLFYKGNLASSLILSEGTPKNWTPENVEIPGILTQNKINQAKLENFYSLSINNYKLLKKMLGLNYNFYFDFQGLEINGNPIERIGNFSQDTANLIKIERFSIYKDKPVKLNFYIWS